MDLTSAKCKIFVAASGAGAGIQGRLWEQPGASSYLEGCVFPYSQEQSSRFLGFRPPKFVCAEEAVDLAIAAYREAAQWCDSDTNPIGLGITCAVTSSRPHKGEHRIFATAISRTQVLSSAIALDKESTREIDGEIADQLGMNLLYLISGLNKYKWCDTEVQDGSDFARRHFLRRPMFLRDGSRGLEPEGQVRLYPGAFNPLHQGHLESADDGVIFHITADPPHKPALSLQEMLERSIQFRGVRDVLFTEGDALYIDKARRFPGASFFVGTDVVERILDPRWGVEIEPMLREFMDLETYFYVSPRGQTELRDLLPRIPEDYRSLFTALPRHEFADMSSTQIRAKAAAAEPTS